MDDYCGTGYPFPFPGVGPSLAAVNVLSPISFDSLGFATLNPQAPGKIAGLILVRPGGK